jgi:hypothetical protein
LRRGIKSKKFFPGGGDDNVKARIEKLIVKGCLPRPREAAVAWEGKH